ncbi:MAG: ZIP family metal transporter [Candidatus Shapirobacteria bacterium]|jgi:zinc and cadmium transporter
MSAGLLSLTSVLFISFVSIIAVLPFLSRLRHLSALVPFLVSLAVGALLGDTFFHLLPASSSFNFVLVGFMVFFVLEKLIRWRHCHDFDCHDDDHSPVIVSLSLVGDLVHNFIDGLAIAGSFYLSPSLGLATSVAVLLHEIPQEIGDFGIYLHAGFSLKKALFLNLLSASSAIIAVLIYAPLSQTIDFTPWLIPATAGGFLYLSASDLIPELHRHHPRLSSSLSQLLGITLGLSLMYLLTFLE